MTAQADRLLPDMQWTRTLIILILRWWWREYFREIKRLWGEVCIDRSASRRGRGHVDDAWWCVRDDRLDVWVQLTTLRWFAVLYERYSTFKKILVLCGFEVSEIEVAIVVAIGLVDDLYMCGEFDVCWWLLVVGLVVCCCEYVDMRVYGVMHVLM